MLLCPFIRAALTILFCVHSGDFSQFKDGESFAGTAFHEMSHSIRREEFLEHPAAFGSPEYAKEELIAELTSAMVCQYCGMDKYIKEDSAPYLKSWLQSLKEDAQFIRTILLDVKRASAMITKVIDEVCDSASDIGACSDGRAQAGSNEIQCSSQAAVAA